MVVGEPGAVVDTLCSDEPNVVMTDIFDRAFQYDPTILNRYTAPRADLRTAAINARADVDAAVAGAAVQTLNGVIQNTRDAIRAREEEAEANKFSTGRSGLGPGLNRPFGLLGQEDEDASNPFANTGPAARIGEIATGATHTGTAGGTGGLIDFNTFKDIIANVSGTTDGRNLDQAVFGLEPQPSLAERQKDFITAAVTGEFPSGDDVDPEDIEEAGASVLSVNHDLPDAAQHLHLPNGDLYFPRGNSGRAHFNGATFYFPGQQSGFFAEGMTHIAREDDLFSAYTAGNRGLFTDFPAPDPDSLGTNNLVQQFYENGTSFFVRGEENFARPVGVSRTDPDNPSNDSGDQFTHHQFVTDLNVDENLNPFYRSNPDYTFPDGTSFFYKDDVDFRSVNDNLDHRLSPGVFRADGSSTEFTSTDSYFYHDGNKTFFRDGEDYYVSDGGDFYWFSGASYQYRSTVATGFMTAGQNFNLFA